MKKKIVSLVAILILLLGVLAGCGESSSNSDKTEVTLLIGKEEVAKELDEMVKAYNDSQENYTVKILPLAGQNVNEKLSSLYASKNAPTMINMGVAAELESWSDKLLDLSDMDIVKGIDQVYLDTTTVDGKIYGIPATIEAFGLLYNKEVLDEAVGGEFNPTTIKTRKDLKEIFEKVEKLDGKNAIQISPMDWSLGAHFTNLLFSNQSEDSTKRHKFLNNLAAGTEELDGNIVYEDWIATLDLMKEYNQAKKNPLAVEYDTSTLALANGDIGFWFMGNWAYPQLAEANPDAQFGILPVPISDEEDVYGGNQISVGVPQSWVIDKEQSTKEQQEGAKDFLTWMYQDEVGQDFYVNKLKFLPISSDFTGTLDDPLSSAIVEYVRAGKTLEWMNTYYPADAYPTMGASLQKYLDGTINRSELGSEIQEYWINSEKK